VGIRDGRATVIRDFAVGGVRESQELDRRGDPFDTGTLNPVEVTPCSS
jgi:hypothetical protein